MKGSTEHAGPLHAVFVLTPVNVDPDPTPGDPLILVTLARIEARLNALAAHLGA